MLGLKQAGIIAHNRLKEYLMKYDDFPYHLTLFLWKNKHLLISFTLVIDDLGIKYVKKEIAEYLLATLRKQYEISTD